MAKLSYNKAALNAQRQELARYKRYLPSLDLKRKQLQQETKSAEAEVARLRADEDAVREEVRAHLPMMANEGVELESLVRVTEFRVRNVNRVGTQVPSLEHVSTRVRDYPLLGTPRWYDHAATLFERAVRLRCERQVAEQTLAVLRAALDRITRRVNLFEKVLVPRTERNIRMISVYLGDMERTAVARAKIAKSRRAEVSP
ncbi:MAG: V-type ATP synthase subunit D [Myxococcales bacterium]|jgi:V/A-type H+-transporting ATPase subunit D